MKIKLSKGIVQRVRRDIKQHLKIAIQFVIGYLTYNKLDKTNYIIDEQKTLNYKLRV